MRRGAGAGAVSKVASKFLGNCGTYLSLLKNPIKKKTKYRFPPAMFIFH